MVRAVKALSAVFTVLAKKDKEKAPLHYWLEDYDVRQIIPYVFTCPFYKVLFI